MGRRKKSTYAGPSANLIIAQHQLRAQQQLRALAVMQAGLPLPFGGGIPLQLPQAAAGGRVSQSSNPIFSNSVKKSESPPLPPKYREEEERALMHHVPHSIIPVQAPNPHYQAIFDLSSTPNISVTQIDMIINPMLMERFTAKRKQMIMASSAETELLSFFGQSDKAISTRLYQSLMTQRNQSNTIGMERSSSLQ